MLKKKEQVDFMLIKSKETFGLHHSFNLYLYAPTLHSTYLAFCSDGTHVYLVFKIMTWTKSRAPTFSLIIGYSIIYLFMDILLHTYIIALPLYHQIFLLQNSLNKPYNQSIITSSLSPPPPSLLAWLRFEREPTHRGSSCSVQRSRSEKDHQKQMMMIKKNQGKKVVATTIKRLRRGQTR